MRRLIDANKLESDMYHNAFEIDTDLQKWDSGCWIRYKMFENVIDDQPTVEAIPKEWIIDYISNVCCGDEQLVIKDMLKTWEEEK